MTDMRFQPGTGVRAVALAICKSRTCEGVSCCQWPANMGRTNCNAKNGAYDDAARAAIAVLSSDVAVGPLTVEDVYANCETTLIGFRDELTECNIKFICDQISRKVMLALSRPHHQTP